MKKLFFLSCIAILFFTSCQTESIDEINAIEEQALEPVIAGKNSLKNNSYMIISKSETLSKELESSISKYGEITRTIPEIGIVLVNSSDPKFESNILSISGVKSIIPDLTVNWLEPTDFDPMVNPASIGDNEWFFSNLWGMDAINAPEAWNSGYTGEGVRIAILDSGIDAEHPDLAPNLNTELSKSFVDGEDWNVSPGFYFNHGTHVAGTIAAADNEFGVIGVAPNAEIIAIKVLSEYSGSGGFGGINAGIVYAANIDADVINMSLGAVLPKNGKFYDDEGNFLGTYSPKLIQELIHAQQRAINYAYKKGVTIVVAAGNDYMNADGNGSTIVMPADLNNVVTVSATGPYAIHYNPDSYLDYPASYTNIGRSLVDIAAPGGDYRIYDAPFWYKDMVYSTISGGWSWSAGTSMASPHVAGVAALIIGKNGGDMDPHEVEKQLFKSADKIDTNGKSLFYGKGRVNAYRAVSE